jgi:penicillin-insensitive murein endopeptidase
MALARPAVRLRRLAALLALAAAPGGCARAPSPLAPVWSGSIGAPSCGVLAGGAEIPADAAGLRCLRHNDRHWGLPRFAQAIERAAEAVEHDRAGGLLEVGDLSTRSGGGPLAPHFSHRSGVDADLLFYVTTVDGAPVESPGFVHFGADGLARDEAHHRWLRLDVDRQWLLAKALLEDPEARIQWIFVSDVVQARLLDWAVARGDSVETIRRARMVMAQPNPGGVHDDHFHIRTACSPEGAIAGCQLVGPRRPWLSYEVDVITESDADLAQSLMTPIEEAD